MELSAFKNVKILCLNEARNIVNDYWTEFDKAIKNYKIAKENNEYDWKTVESDQYSFIPFSTELDNVYFFFEDWNAVSNFKQAGLKRIYKYSELDPDYKIKNELFNYRINKFDEKGQIIGKQRAFNSEIYTKVIKYDWKIEKEKVDRVQSLRNKPKLIFLGTAQSELEKQNLAYLINKYQDEYNIYYKGHPNFSVIDNWINDTVLKGDTINYKDPFTNENKSTSLKKGSQLVVLNNQIASEHLTYLHSAEPDNFWFEKIAAGDSSTGALDDLANPTISKNTTSDLIFANLAVKTSDKTWEYIPMEPADNNSIYFDITSQLSTNIGKYFNHSAFLGEYQNIVSHISKNQSKKIVVFDLNNFNINDIKQKIQEALNNNRQTSVFVKAVKNPNFDYKDSVQLAEFIKVIVPNLYLLKEWADLDPNLMCLNPYAPLDLYTSKYVNDTKTPLNFISNEIIDLRN
ncbi:hypothetical protein [Mycoplasmopsis felifaucium]|uniref:hypothetical protein n=1 Tax=Mycoplasmopsis felifaucium TaxID=35768 RepID=UPI00048487F9|nr:hypothetical protein [Mycoplasmopsis felifaucium]